METNLVLDGTKFMFLGIGTVFLFLLVMVFVVRAVMKGSNRSISELKSVSLEEIYTKTHTEHMSEQQKRKIVAAITAAIMYHRSKQDNKKVIAAVTAAIMHHSEG
jgi:oxaloacetate decarboxylase gamma subunit